MPKPNLQIVRQVGDAPSLGVCEACNAQFFAPAYTLGHKKEAQAAIEEQFNKHKKYEDSAQAVSS